MEMLHEIESIVYVCIYVKRYTTFHNV